MTSFCPVSGQESQIWKHNLSEFLRHQQSSPLSSHIVIGNEAGDADSIISAITLAYIESAFAKNEDQQHHQEDNSNNKKRNLEQTVATRQVTHKTPIVSISKNDLLNQRPDIKLMFDLVEVDSNTLLDINDLHYHIKSSAEASEKDKIDLDVTLVDHNYLTLQVDAPVRLIVREIVDHHSDMGKHLDTCSQVARKIAFENNKSTVASTCTLVVERLLELWDATTTDTAPQIPVAISILLLGTILLDSTNLSLEAGKVTPRDVAAVNALLKHTNWEKMSPQARELLTPSPAANDESLQPNTKALFTALQKAKHDIQFWKSLSVRDALRLDFKKFTFSSENKDIGSNNDFGLSTVLMPLKDFVTKPNLVQEIRKQMDDVKIPLLGVMFSFSDNRVKKRQILLCARTEFCFDKLIQFLVDEQYSQESLQLTELQDIQLDGENNDLLFRSFNQGNTKASRKQTAPILLQFSK